MLQIDSKMNHLDEHMKWLCKEAGNKVKTVGKSPENKRMLNVNNLHSKKICEICSKLKIKTAGLTSMTSF